MRHRCLYKFDNIWNIEEELKFLSELNAVGQVNRRTGTAMVWAEWRTSGIPKLHARVYDIKMGLIKVLEK